MNVVVTKLGKRLVEQAFSTKFLEVIINENLTWSDHVYVLLNKTSKNLGVIRKLSKSLPLDILYSIYNTHINSYLQYCNTAWATCNTSTVDKLFRMQKATRIIAGNKWNSHTDNQFKNCNNYKLGDINWLQVGCFVYHVINGNTPDSFTNYFLMTPDIHTHFTRGIHDIHQLTHRIIVRASCIKIFGMKVWNKIPTALRSLSSVCIFKSKYKRHLLNYYLLLWTDSF